MYVKMYVEKPEKNLRKNVRRKTVILHYKNGY